MFTQRIFITPYAAVCFSVSTLSLHPSKGAALSSGGCGFTSGLSVIKEPCVQSFNFPQ